MTATEEPASSGLVTLPGSTGHQDVAISIRGLTKIFSKARGPAAVPALEDIDLDVRVGEFLVLLGPSGCGKTTLMRCIAGLERPTRGAISIGDEVVFDAGRRIDHLKRPVSMIFQAYALWPHMTAFQHVAFPLQCAGVKRADRGPRVTEILNRVDIGHLSDRYPGQMSGGQQQRLAFARALVVGQDVMLMDEPLSNVDAQVRERLRLEMIKIQRSVHFTAIYVTHDQAEAMELGDRIAVMSKGRIAQIGTPSEIFNDPADLAVARCVGQTNEIPFVVEKADAKTGRVNGKSLAGPVSATLVPRELEEVPEPGTELIAFGRPRDYFITAKGATAADSATTADTNTFRARVEAIRFLGTHTEYVVQVDDVRMRARVAQGVPVLREGDNVIVAINPDTLRAGRLR